MDRLMRKDINKHMMLVNKIGIEKQKFIGSNDWEVKRPLNYYIKIYEHGRKIL